MSFTDLHTLDTIMINQQDVINHRIQTLTSQLDYLEATIRANPSLGSLLYQGNPLHYYVSTEGRNAVFRALHEGHFDQVSLAHGIKRLSIHSFTGEVLWDYHPSGPKLVFDDAIVCLLEENASKIIEESISAIEVCSKFPDSDSLTNKGGLWSYRSFYDKLGVPNDFLHSLCPCTSAVLKRLDLNLALGFAFFSVVTPGTRIGAHKGSTSLRYRYHLGLKVPSSGTARIRVDDQWIVWQKGKAFGFNDSLDHEVENPTTESRAVLILDVWSSHLPPELVRVLKNHREVFNFCILSRSADGFALND